MNCHPLRPQFLESILISHIVAEKYYRLERNFQLASNLSECRSLVPFYPRSKFENLLALVAADFDGQYE